MKTTAVKRTAGGYEVADFSAPVTLEHVRQSIAAAYPEFKIRKIKPLKGGMANVAFEVNGEYIFRFPRNEKAARSLIQDFQVVPEIRRRITTPIPKFELMDGKGAFVGYRKLPGKPLTKRRATPFMAVQLAKFFRDLHPLHIPGVPAWDMKAHFEGEFRDAREYVFPLLPTKHQWAIEGAFRWYLGNSGKFDFIPVLLHGDLEAEHILTRGDRITGILDWSAVRMGDPVYDFWRPYSHFGKKFTDVLLQQYGYGDVGNVREIYQKMEFFWLAQLVHRLLRRILAEDRKGIAEKIEQLKAHFR